MHSIPDFNHVCIYYRNTTLDEPEKRNAILQWAQFYTQANQMCIDLVAAYDFEKNSPQFDKHLKDACNHVHTLVEFITVFPKDWQNVQLHFHIPGKAPYVLTYAQLEMKMYELKAKYFEYNTDLGKYRDPCTRHFPSNRLLRNQ
jgi:hypothetical protein